MRHFNNFTGKEIEEWEVMKKFTVTFKGDLLHIEFICMFITRPEHYFLITEPEDKACLMSKKSFMGKPYWISKFSQSDATELATLIEQQAGVALPEKETNNPFEYEGGDIEIRIFRDTVKDVTIRKSKAPFGHDIYYQVILSESAITIAQVDWPEKCYLPVDSGIKPSHFELLSDIITKFEQRNKWEAEICPPQSPLAGKI